MITFAFLPADIKNLIHDFAGIREMWKTRFTNDVLPLIDQGHLIVGTFTLLEKEYPCKLCYMYGHNNNYKFCINCTNFDDELNVPYTTMPFSEFILEDRWCAHYMENYADYKRFKSVRDSNYMWLSRDYILAAVHDFELKNKLKTIYIM